MRVLKFGGTSVANAERFLRVADILESNARPGAGSDCSLLPPAKITNHLVAMIEKTISGQDALPNISDAERIFSELLTGLAAAQPGFPLAQLKVFVEQEFAQIKHILHGISLLGQCPDSIQCCADLPWREDVDRDHGWPAGSARSWRDGYRSGRKIVGGRALPRIDR
ncbi:bifunctional aspartokinase I/homoserine dehydrogenase I [Citrobacter koseri]|uniref:Bifunctional aspartokinase I/homoserine dehydrogenase I n=1 Tax=Citrobacter koseri TaxID=545 RepID=A0A2X2VAT1_CITKO|nr:bifunctional aspartokinase I/homoserine dehydrogenase I [Citrobacter koseri]